MTEGNRVDKEFSGSEERAAAQKERSERLYISLDPLFESFQEELVDEWSGLESPRDSVLIKSIQEELTLFNASFQEFKRSLRSAGGHVVPSGLTEVDLQLLRFQARIDNISILINRELSSDDES